MFSPNRGTKHLSLMSLIFDATTVQVEKKPQPFRVEELYNDEEATHCFYR